MTKVTPKLPTVGTREYGVNDYLIGDCFICDEGIFIKDDSSKGCCVNLITGECVNGDGEYFEGLVLVPVNIEIKWKRRSP